MWDQFSRFNTKFGKRLFEYNGTRLWNALPCNVRNEEDIEVFKKKAVRISKDKRLNTVVK